MDPSEPAKAPGGPPRREGIASPPVRWVARPSPLRHELLSSWLHRLALANGLKDHTFCRHMFGRQAVWTRDLDRSFSTENQATLALWTGVSQSRIEAMTLPRWAGRLSESVNAHGNSDWILPMGVFHRIRRRHGLLFCPVCLADGAGDAYWPWRMAWSTACVRHRILLQDGCPRCDSPYMPHRSAPSLFGRSPCACCGFDLSNSPPETARTDDWMFQERLQSALVRGRTAIMGVPYFPLTLFLGIRALATALMSRAGEELVHRLTGQPPLASMKPGTKRDIENQPLHVRRQVIRGIWPLLEDWPHQFRAHLRRARARRWWFVWDRGPLPFWLQVEVDRLTLNYPPGPPARVRVQPDLVIVVGRGRPSRRL